VKIGQVSAATGVSQRMIRHYEKIGLIPRALRRESGYRDYDEGDVNTVGFIRRARDLGFPIEEIGQLLALWRDRGRASSEVKALALARAAELKRKAAQLDEMRKALEHLASSCHGDDRPDCPILVGLEGAGRCRFSEAENDSRTSACAKTSGCGRSSSVR
jgi:MerR family copper efflux transcriptional regulator